jgi:hypothetical protein
MALRPAFQGQVELRALLDARASVKRLAAEAESAGVVR